MSQKSKQLQRSMRVKKQKRVNPYVLAIAPATGGFGYAIFHSQQKLFDWGVTHFSINRVNRSMACFEKLIKRYQPNAVVIGLPQRESKEETIAKKIIDAFSKYAAVCSIPFKRLTRAEVQALFSNFGVNTKEEITEKIIEFMPYLKQDKPERRSFFEREDKRMKIFDAVSLGLTYYSSLDDAMSLAKNPVNAI